MKYYLSNLIGQHAFNKALNAEGKILAFQADLLDMVGKCRTEQISDWKVSKLMRRGDTFSKIESVTQLACSQDGHTKRRIRDLKIQLVFKDGQTGWFASENVVFLGRTETIMKGDVVFARDEMGNDMTGTVLDVDEKAEKAYVFFRWMNFSDLRKS